jgi:ATP-dependent DNA ligase
MKPVLVGQFEFVEWTPDNHLRHSRFIALREEKGRRTICCGDPREQRSPRSWN